MWGRTVGRGRCGEVRGRRAGRGANPSWVFDLGLARVERDGLALVSIVFACNARRVRSIVFTMDRSELERRS